jgi:nucleotide-binding universal stress UspA family protein
MGLPPDGGGAVAARLCGQSEREVDVAGPVICGVEGPQDEGVARVARGLAERYALPLLLVHVSEAAGGDEDAARVLRELSGPGRAELAIVSGHPADRLVAIAAERGASFVVLGNHGPRSSLLGSISADVSRRASCPVIVVPPTADSPGRGAAERAPEVEGGIVRLELGRGARRVA